MGEDRPVLVLRAPAKINLYLHVLGKRSDGYHNLETWMQKVDLCDTVTLEVLDQPGRVEFVCNDLSIPQGQENLAAKAALAFFNACSTPVSWGVRITLDKVIPVAAGLGGGSSDAGTVLRGLNELSGGIIDEQQLLQLACSLGADVPFFAVGHRAVIARGIGEILHPIASLEDCWFILVNPNFFVSTAWVFQNLPLTTEPKPSRLTCFQRYGSVSSFLSEMHNDLEAVTTAKYPEIDDIKELLLRAGAARVLMSGSGPTVFGVFPDRDAVRYTDLHSVVEALRRQGKERTYLLRAFAGASPSGKAPGFDPGIRRFESFRPSHC
jgi:4-diphosphocytidyl-2-C-methyl-D-erythritol kinase